MAANYIVSTFFIGATAASQKTHFMHAFGTVQCIHRRANCAALIAVAVRNPFAPSTLRAHRLQLIAAAFRNNN